MFGINTSVAQKGSFSKLAFIMAVSAFVVLEWYSELKTGKVLVNVVVDAVLPVANAAPKKPKPVKPSKSGASSKSKVRPKKSGTRTGAIKKTSGLKKLVNAGSKKTTSNGKSSLIKGTRGKSSSGTGRQKHNRVTPRKNVTNKISQAKKGSKQRRNGISAAQANLKGAKRPGYLSGKFASRARGDGLKKTFKEAANPGGGGHGGGGAAPPPGPALRPRGPVFKP